MPRSDRILDGQVVELLQGWGHELGFSQIGVAGIDLHEAEEGLRAWLAAGFHGSLAYMERHGLARARPADLVPGTASVITACMDYLPRAAPADWAAHEIDRLTEPAQAVVSVYARGRDYHKVLRARLRSLADRLAAHVGPLGFRVFTDSAPVLEAELAVRSGLGWRGKHTLVLHREGGSMRFLGEIYVDALLPPTPAVTAHCGECSRCLEVCPTQAIVAPYRLDARRCISYLTIEHDGAIPRELRPAIGNRIYGCDDCQLACPWNKYARRAVLADFDVRHGLDRAGLLDLWQWDEATFLARTEGSAMRRAGWQRWRRNLSVALGNALRDTGDARIGGALAAARPSADALVAEHIDWALDQRGQVGARPVGAAPASRVEPAPPPGSDA